MIRKYILSGLFIFLLVIKGFAQTKDSSANLVLPAKFKISGYIDAYYAYYAYYTDSMGAVIRNSPPSIPGVVNLDLTQRNCRATSEFLFKKIK